jgi:hypothetical protein
MIIRTNLDCNYNNVEHYFTLVESLLNKPTTLIAIASVLVDNLNSLTLMH